MIDPAQFKLGMRRLAAGVSVVATIEEGVPHGFVATAVTSVAADPTPTLLVCVNRSVSCHDVIERSRVFCVNLLAEADIEIARRFSSPQDRHLRFAESRWRPLATGAPALHCAIASFDCVVTETVSVHSHSVFLGTVVDIALPDEGACPLLYAGGRFDALRSSGQAAVSA